MINLSPDLIKKTALNIANMPPEKAAKQIRGFAKMADKNTQAKLAAWAMLPDDQLVAGFMREAQAFPILLPIAQSARPDWIVQVAHQLRPRKMGL